MKHFGVLSVIFIIFKVLSAATIEDKYEPMVAFICDRPAMYRGVSGWIVDKSTDCLDKMEDILDYCRLKYPDHNITNVVEASYLVTIPNWPMGTADRQYPHRVRPFRCLVGGFQSDALLVPQHCEFDHRHDQSVCEGFSHWNIVADEACKKKDMHLESFGMLLNCKLGKFSGVEYVCCPNQTEAMYHPPQSDDKPDKGQNSSEENESSDEENDNSNSDDDDDENTVDLYEAYLRGQEFPHKYNNEHKKFLAAKERMKKNQQHKIAKLLQDWQAARDNVNKVRKTDSKSADKMAKEITERFQNLYAAYEQEDEAEKEQLVALHLQHVQSALNEKKREAMDKFIKALETKDVAKIEKNLRAYIKAEEKDRLHTVNHFEHVKYSAPHEAVRIHPFIVNHLRLSEQRIDQAMEMLTRYPEIDAKIRPVVEEFMKRFDAIANSIKDIVLPEPKVEQEPETTTQSADISKTVSSENINSNNEANRNDVSESSNNSEEVDTGSHELDEGSDIEEEDTHEDEHDFESKNDFVAHHMQDTHHLKQGFAESAASNSQVGSTIGIALGGVSVFVIIVVAIIMLRRNKSRQSVSHGYVEVDPSASPEERHLANMQMNGYENPTYKYFEVQNNPRA